MAQTDVDPYRIINALSLQLAQANLTNTTLQIQLDDAQRVIEKQATPSADTATDGT